MSAGEVVIVRTGAANLASVLAALGRLGVQARVSEEPDAVRKAAAVVLPGVGAFGPAMRVLRERGIDAALRDRAVTGRPLLAVCLGLQLLCEWSEESPGDPGLGVVSGCVARFAGDDALRVPHMGWNRIEPMPGAALIDRGWAYFANSYRLGEMPAGWRGAWSDYGGRFVASLERGAVLACQFHPELSASWGRRVLERWLALAGVASGAREQAAPEPSPC